MPSSSVEPARISSIAGRPGTKSLTVLLVTAFAISLVILKFAPAPFFWSFLLWAAAMFVAVFLVRGDWSRGILLSLFSVACVLAGLEAYLIKHEYLGLVIHGNFFVHDPILGWAPAKGIKVHAFKPGPAGLFHGPRGTLFDADYTIDSRGLRVSPPWRKDGLAGTALFFGCSYTFGEGLQDSQTLPYQVGLLSHGSYRTINFAFEGYSPAQMLASVEHGLVKSAVDTTPNYAYYIAEPIHVWRVAGRVAWGTSPRYLFNADGDVVQDGFYAPKTLYEILGLKQNSRIRGQLEKSAIWRTLLSRESRVTDQDIQLYLAVVRRWHDLLSAQFPGIQIRIILWRNQAAPEEQLVYDKMREGFRRMGYPVYLVEDILPGYRVDFSPYILGPTDHHPNALADHLLGEFLWHQMQEPVASHP
jgi:hypothetical protein